MISFTGKIRLYLLLVALLPPLIILWVFQSQLTKQAQQQQFATARSSLEILYAQKELINNELERQAQQLLELPAFQTSLARLKRGQATRAQLPRGRFDFVELLKSDGTVVASAHRPGMVGQTIASPASKKKFHETVEYDINGRHAAMTILKPLTDELSIYGGRFIGQSEIDQFQLVSSATIKILFENDSLYSDRMEPGQLYRSDNGYTALFMGERNGAFYALATFDPPMAGNPMLSVFSIAAIVALAAVIIAILLGIYITGKAKREIENLRQASARIAAGDLDTPVMAYSEGEFSELADTMTDMTIKLKAARRQLTASEKIAAWQTMGRKIAHEIKNPLTPLALSADDLRRSYIEKQPDFDKILLQTTSTIKSETKRLTELLDQFVSFARMTPPKLIPATFNEVVEQIKGVYAAELASGRLVIADRKLPENKLSLDPDQVTQVLINLIKNSLESSDKTIVTVTTNYTEKYAKITISDNGPGFTTGQLDDGFEPYVTSKPDGSGLGMIICQRIIFDHGGTFEYNNHPDGGAIVTINFPSKHG